MKKHISITLAMAVGAALLAACTPVAFAQSIGVSFVSDGSVSGIGGRADTNTDSMLPSDLAGVAPYAQTNWNNLGRYGSVATAVLTNSAGGTNLFLAQWDSGGAAATGTAAGLGTADGKLMNGFIYSWGPGPATALGTSVYNSTIQNKPLFYISGLESFYTNQNAEGYNIVLYTTGYSYWETEEGWIQSVSGNPLTSTMVEGTDLTPHVFEQNTGPFTGTYVQATGTSSGSRTAGANYMIFRGLTNDAVLIRLQSGGYGAGLNGFQIVPQFPEAPTPTPPTFSPSDTVYALVPVTITEAVTGDPFHPELYYQWYSDNASGGPVTSIILDATNATLNVTPTNNVSTYYIQYQVVVTNIFGASTSSVATLTVNPAVAPFITTDTTPGAGNGITDVYAYVGGMVSFTAAFGGTPPTYLWQSNLVNIPNATSTTLTLANVQLSTSASYRLTATNQVGDSSSTPVALTVLPDPAAPDPVTQLYFQRAYTNNPWAYWRLNETNDPTATITSLYQAYDYSGHGFSATYGNAVTVSNVGPRPPAFPGFDANELAAGTTVSTPDAYLTVPALHLAGNKVTFIAWINPNGAQAASAGLLFNRNGTDAAGFGFSSTTDELGYTWNTNNANTYDWHSGLIVADNNWNFVAYVITPTNATLYLGNLAGGTTNFQQSTHVLAHTGEAWGGGTILLGSDSNGTGYNRNFHGLISEATLFTNALSTLQIQEYFLTAIGASGLAPTVGATTISLTVPLYSGQNVLLRASVSGTEPIGLQWQSSPDGSTWADVPGATSATAVVNPFTVGTVYYQLVASNLITSVTNSSVSATFNALPASPAGLWTVNFQVTNNVLNYTTGGGVGHYVGRGILGTGMYWNILPDTAGAWGYVARIDSVSDLLDDGTTHSGIYCTLFNASGFGSATSVLPLSSDIGNLLYQWVTIGTTPTNALQFHGVPDGTYNLAVYGIDGTWADRGTTFVVHDALNGDQTKSTVNAAPAVPLAEGNNFVLFTGVHVSGGTLNVDVGPTSPVPTHDPNTEADINAAQLQLVSLDVPAPTVTLTSQYTPANGSTNGTLTLSWTEGMLETATNLLGPWTTIYAPSPITITMTMTNAVQFYRVKVQ